jgi:hypothetical protein
MSSPTDPDHGQFDLVGLIAGELGRDETINVGRHLHSCSQCTVELIDLVVAHGALAAASTAFLQLDDVPEIRRGPDARLADMVGHDAEHHALPLLEVDATAIKNHMTGPRRVALVVAGVAAAVLVLVGVATFLVRSDNTPSGDVVASAPLKPIDAPALATGSIKAVAVGGTRDLIVNTKNLEPLSGQHFYEVWMLNPTTQKMLPVGVLPPSGTGTYSIGASIMTGYSAVDISLQTNNGNPAHSNTSVLRATF